MSEPRKVERVPVPMQQATEHNPQPYPDQAVGHGDLLGESWRLYATFAAISLGVIGWPTIFSIGVPLLITAHVLLVIVLLFNSAPRRDRARAAVVLLPVMWWPVTLMAAPGAAPVLLAWAAYRRILARRGRAWNGPTWPKLVIAAALAAGASVATALAMLLSS